VINLAALFTTLQRAAYLVIFFGFFLKSIQCIKFLISHGGLMYCGLPEVVAAPVVRSRHAYGGEDYLMYAKEAQ
jgi:hypothetical protein